jgi:hypothetical protein
LTLKQGLPDLTQIFIQAGKECWCLVKIQTLELSHGVWTGKTGSMVAIMQK